MNFANLKFSAQDGVALVRFAKPGDPANSLNLSFLSEIGAAISQAQGMADVSVLIFTGTGRTFSTGADLTELNGLEAAAIPDFLGAGQELLRQILGLDLVTIAGLNGVALGGGLELALACDLRWAHARAVMGLPEAKLGLVPGWGGLALLPQVVPQSAVVELLTGGEFLSSGKALEMGLVDRLFQGPDFEEQIIGAAQKLFLRPGNETREIKALMKRGRTAPDLASANEAFLRLWRKRERAGRP